MSKIPAKELIEKNSFFVALVCFVCVLPFSEALVSVFSGVVLITAIVEDRAVNKWRRFKNNRILLFITGIYFIYLISAFFSGEFHNSLYDLRKNLFFLVFPVAFLFGKELSSRQKQFVFSVFSIAVIISTFIAFFRWKLFPVTGTFYVHKISLISHIRFSFQLILAFWFLVLILYKNKKKIKHPFQAFFILTAIYLVGFLFIQQSITGVVAFVSSAFFFIFYAFHRGSGKLKQLLLFIAFLLVSIPVAYLSQAISRFYDFEEVDERNIALYTAKGNPYRHDFENPEVENGHYVYLYVCEDELREEWNKRSEFAFDSVGFNGYPIKATLLRYLTSKGLKKDAEGVKALTEPDVQNIERGIANVIFENARFSLYPRIYQTIWEYYTYSKTGYANNQSFSQRIEFAKAAVTIIEHNFWTGVGTANWEDAFRMAFKANESSLDPEYYASSHNQYLNYLVKFGFIGFLLILFFLAYPVIKTKRYKDPCFMLFLVFMFFVNFADSNFETHMGGAFFVFFYCLFLITDGFDYLKIEHPSE